MSFLDHLTELRNRMAVCVAAIFVTTLFIGLPFSKPFIKVLMKPLQKIEIKSNDERMVIQVRHDGVMVMENPLDVLNAFNEGDLSNFRFDFRLLTDDEETSASAEGEDEPKGEVISFGPDPQNDLYYFSAFDPFFLILKAGLLLGIALAIPIWLSQVWLFVSPAFTPSEMRAVRPVFFSSVFLFPAGATFAYFSMSLILQMLFSSFHIEGLEPRLDISKYFALVLKFMLIFGCVFETPVVIVMLVRLGVVSTKTLRSTRQYALLAIAIMSACLTPADPISMLMMALPVCILYELSIWISVAIERKIEAEWEEESEDEDEE